MGDLIERALAANVGDASAAVVATGVIEAGHQADLILGTGPVPGSAEWQAEEGTDRPAQRQLAWQLACLRIQLAAGIDSVETVMSLRRFGATWAIIGRAAGVTRQSAHERWGRQVAAILDPYGAGMPPAVPDDDPVAP
ncbi:hypothetical protein [Rhodococcus sp. NPDC058514]|uniref:hypothetical protein n=1 Tax=unclassified Rhodococcus (in: high G+C Gram-positive bacteria) TaxID=192944 RepID=UPI0036513CD2